ncbi:hypothetical protein K505DRAFT_148733 [Melanomma pulvis-pyrius CBS 109.77]|uniref:Uncharacterized protein n=1 Tax=Melanomma pulvis-pyrius CBS 109.77 TaxID=1314802 RepID=A0A6A6XKV1_9PLEO|nr:hypothetical protein K505DRAFT_148733 [Melanomma pulvis-pyrius CBS 109.77]
MWHCWGCFVELHCISRHSLALFVVLISLEHLGVFIPFPSHSPYSVSILRIDNPQRTSLYCLETSHDRDMCGALLLSG